MSSSKQMAWVVTMVLAGGGMVSLAFFEEGLQPYHGKLLAVCAACALLPAVWHQIRHAPRHVVCSIAAATFLGLLSAMFLLIEDTPWTVVMLAMISGLYGLLAVRDTMQNLTEEYERRHPWRSMAIYTCLALAFVVVIQLDIWVLPILPR